MRMESSVENFIKVGRLDYRLRMGQVNFSSQQHMMAEVMIQDMEDAAAWLLTLPGEELMQEAAVPKKIVEEYFFLWRNCSVI